MASEVIEAHVSSDDINAFFEKIAPLVQNEPGALVQAALITLLLQNIGPEDMTDDELSRGVHDVSTLIVLYCEKLRLAHNITDLNTLMRPKVVES